MVVSVGRNDPCPCGSGLKYKKCCMKHPQFMDFDDSASELLTNAYKKLSDRNWEEALSLFEQVLPSSTAPHIIYEAIAACFDGMDDCQRAMAAYERALETCPEARRGTILFRYAATKARCKQWEEALDAFGQYRSVVQRDEEIKGTDILIDMIRRIQDGELNENFFEANFQLSRAFTAMDEERFDDAVKRFERARELEPDDPAIYFNLGVAYTFVKEEDKAIETFQTCVNLNPLAAEAYYNMGQIYLLRKEDFSKALSCFSRAASVRPDYVGAHHQKGTVYELLGDPKKALECWEKTLELDPNNTMAKDNIERVKDFINRETIEKSQSEEST